MLFISLKVLEYPFKQNKNMLKKHESAVMYVLKKSLKICSKFTGEHPCRSAISNKVAKHLFSEHLFLRTPLTAASGCSTRVAV